MPRDFHHRTAFISDVELQGVYEGAYGVRQKAARTEGNGPPNQLAQLAGLDAVWERARLETERQLLNDRITAAGLLFFFHVDEERVPVIARHIATWGRPPFEIRSSNGNKRLTRIFLTGGHTLDVDESPAEVTKIITNL